MLDLSSIPRDTWWGRALRKPLDLLPGGLVVPILQGPARGLTWIVGSSNHGCWLGSYEAAATVAFAEAVDPGQVVYDIGAHVGWYTLLGSRLVGSSGRVVAFEPSPRNLRFLERHVDLNDAENVTVVEGAVSDVDGQAGFDAGASHSTAALADEEEATMTVRTVTLDRLVSSGRLPPPDLVKVDVEGEEEAVLEGAGDVLASSRPVLLLSVHGAAAERACRSRLRHVGYRVEPVRLSGGGHSPALTGLPRRRDRSR